MKKLYTLALAVLLVLGLSVTAFAAAPKQLHLGELAEMDEDAAFTMEQLLSLLQEAYDLGYKDGQDGNEPLKASKARDFAATSAAAEKGQIAAAASVPVTRSSDTISYVLNTNSKKFHYPDCSSAAAISPENRQDFSGSRAEVIAMGYEPCKRCKP